MSPELGMIVGFGAGMIFMGLIWFNSLKPQPSQPLQLEVEPFSESTPQILTFDVDYGGTVPLNVIKYNLGRKCLIRSFSWKLGLSPDGGPHYTGQIQLMPIPQPESTCGDPQGL